MRFYILAACLAACAACASLQAGFLPTAHLDSNTIKAFQDYIANFEKSVPARFASTGKLWIDDQCCGKRNGFDSGKPVVEPRENQDVASGSIHHFSGVIFVKGGTIEAVRRVMEDYPNYVKYFKPDLGDASGTKLPDSTPDDDHFKSRLTIVQSTLWMNVTYDSVYDTHYRRLDQNRWTARSTLDSIKELRDPGNPREGTYPEGDDHGFLWKTNTYWFARERNGGLELEADSITLSRPTPTGFAWWATRRTREAVDKMLHDVKAAIELVR